MDIPNKRIPLTILIFPFTNADNDPNTAPFLLMDTQLMHQHTHLPLHSMTSNYNCKIPSVKAPAMTITMHVSLTMILMMKTKKMAMKKPLLNTTMDTSTTKAVHTTSVMTTIHPCPHVSTGFAPSRTFYLHQFPFALHWHNNTQMATLLTRKTMMATKTTMQPMATMEQVTTMATKLNHALNAHQWHATTTKYHLPVAPMKSRHVSYNLYYAGPDHT